MFRIGQTVVSDLPKEYAERFKESKAKEVAANRMLQETMKEKWQTWENLKEDFGLDINRYIYKYDEEASSIVVYGYADKSK